MRSKAQLKGHPLHPILIPFPIAFFTGTLVFDLLGYRNDRPDFWQTGGYLEVAGIVGALAAAVPGLIDYTFTVPPNSSAKKRATLHGLTNITMVVLFAAALYFRRQEHASTYLVLGLEAAGFVLMLAAGWMGGTLVYRNQIGVDPRYADAGKWKEARIRPSGGPVAVAEGDELKVNQMKLLHFGAQRIVLGRSEKGYVAFDDRCPHKGGSLAGGAMVCGTVQCPWHGSQFDVHTGAVTAGPSEEKIRTYPITERNGKVYLELSQPS